MRNHSANKRFVFIISIILNIIFVAVSVFFIGKRYYYYRSGLIENRKDIISQKDYVRKFNKQEVDLFKILPHDTTDIVFLGTSLTHGFPLQEMFNDCRLKNRGIIGNTTTDILNRLFEVTGGKPEKVFLEVGTNDIGDNSINSTLFNLVKIITTIKRNSPRTKIYIQSVLPFGTIYTPKIEAYNKKVELYCLSNQIPFINIYPYFLGNKAMKKELTTDGIHLTAKVI